MAEAIVTFVVERLSDLLTKEAQLLYGVHDQFKWVQRELRRMQCFLKDADSKQKKDERVKNWVAEIRDISYEVEDVIDTFILSQTAQRRRHGFVGHVKRYISEPIIRHNVGKEIERIKLKINEISRSRETYGIRDINEEKQEASSSSHRLQERRRLFTALEDLEVVGLQEEINTVREQLMSEESRRCVISIVSMGGLGKTTLAKKVFHDVKKHFDCHAFIYLSQQYEIKNVLIRIVKSVMSLSREEDIEKMEKLNEEDLGTMLCGHLREKRYLVVVDDIWSIEAWETLKLILPDAMNQSRVMLTTRIIDVALHADPLCHPHKMRLLNANEGWELFMKKIFPGGNPSTACPSELEETGRIILEKCGGLPLAILVLGGLLARKDKRLDAWSKVLQSVNWHFTESSTQCMEILALSYQDLPSYLKPCFLYLGLFPEDYQIDSFRIMTLWIAEGFIQQKDKMILEDVAEDYLEELIGRSMIQVASENSNGSIRRCRIHDLLRDLSIFEARQNSFFTIHNDNGTASSSTSVRRLSLHGSIDENCSIATLRSILCFPGSKVHLSKLLNAGNKLLRVLDANGTEFSEDIFLKEVGEFVLLRYLRLKNNEFRSLPSSIGNLSNLQILKLKDTGTLPSTICNLKQLRHLHAWFYDIAEYSQLSNLKHLQTLCLQAGIWIEESLGRLTNLRKLGIYGDLTSHQKTFPNSIAQLLNLRSLKLYDACTIPPFMPFTHHLYLYKMSLEGRIEKLTELPPNLIELNLVDSELEQDAISVMETLAHLKILKLTSSYSSKKMICSSRGFPRLKLLALHGLSLEEWIVEAGAFPQLELLELECLPQEDWIIEEGAMPSLKDVQASTMSNLGTLPEQVRGLLCVESED